MDPGHVDLQDAATELGVHCQTAYKWVRSGALPAVLVQGRYLLDRAVVTQFAEQRTQPQSPRSPRPRRPRGGITALADRMFDHLVAGDEHKARQVVSGLVGDGVALTTVVQEVLVPALGRIGTGYLGADVPTDELVRFCRDTPVDLAVITDTNASVGHAADHTAARIEAQGVCTLLGRPGSTLDELQRRARRRRSRSG